MNKSRYLKAPFFIGAVCCLVLSLLLVGVGHQFTQRAKTSPDLFVAEDTVRSDWFGSAVDIHEDIMVVTAFKADTHVVDSGAAYVFHRLNDGTISPVQKIIAPEAKAGDEFGFDVAINERWLVISRLGGFQDRSKLSTQGDVLVYEKPPGENAWLFHSRIQEPDPVSGNYFGFSVDVAGDLLAVGAVYSLSGEIRPGAAYLVNLASNDRRVVPLVIPSVSDADSVGSDVLFVGDRLFIGAPGTSISDIIEVGAVHEFSVTDPGRPEFVGTLHPAELLAEDRYGTSLASPTGYLVVGAGHWAAKGNNEVAWLHSLIDIHSVATKISVPSQSVGAMLGFRASAFGDHFVLSAHLESASSVPSAGAVHLFRLVESRAQYVGKLSAEIPEKNDFFGVAIAAGDKGVLVGVEKADQTGNGSGAAGFFAYEEFMLFGVQNP